MIVNGEAFTQRLKTYSDNTMLLISEINDNELFTRAMEIVATTDTEEEVVKKLLQLKHKLK